MTVGDVEVDNLSYELEVGKRTLTILRDVSFSMKSGNVLSDYLAQRVPVNLPWQNSWLAP